MEQCLGAYPADNSDFWTPPDFWDADDLAMVIEEHPSVWTDDSREEYLVGGFVVAGAGIGRLLDRGSWFKMEILPLLFNI